MVPSAARNLEARAVLLVAALTAGGLLMAAALAGPARAASLTVTNADDSGAGSLRQAITDANANVGEDTIGFAPSLSGQTIALASQLPIVTDGAGLAIEGAGANITISGNDAGRVFEVGDGGKLALNNLTVADGSVNTDVGGGIYNSGALMVSNSTVSGNEANHGAGIYNQGTMTVSNSTVSNNRAHVGDSSIVNFGPATLENTIVANTAIADGSLSPGNCAGTSPITDGGHNLDSGTDCGFATENDSLSGTEPLLGALADNGGPTKTHALLVGSPAIDEGDPFGATADQRGVARPQGSAADIGAFEVDTTAPRVTRVVPAENATGVAPGTNVAATFSEAMRVDSVGPAFKLYKKGSTRAIGATVAYDAAKKRAVLNPGANLKRGANYKAVVGTGAEDLSGNPLDQKPGVAGDQARAWSFKVRK